jgi:hypothetical protein
MTNSEWKQCISDLLDGVERELPPIVPAETKDIAEISAPP